MTGADELRQPRSLFARVARNFAWGMLAELSGKGALFLVSVYLAGILGTANFGEFSFLQTIFVFLWMGVDLGMNMYATREVARHPNDIAGLLVDLSSMRFVLALVVSLLTLAAIAFRAQAQLLYLTLGFGAYLIVRAIQPDWLLRGIEQYRALAIANTATAVILLIATYLLIDGPDDFALASVPWFISYLIGTIAVAIALRHSKIPLWQKGAGSGPRGWWRHWSESIHFTLSNGVSGLYQNIPLLYIHWQGSAHATGLFAAPFRLVVALLFVASVLPMTIYPVIADLQRRRRATALTRLIAWVAGLTALATGVISTIVIIGADFIVDRLFGPEYHESAFALRWLSVFLLLRSVRAVFARVVCGMGHQRRYSIVSILAVACLLVFLEAFSLFGLDVIAGASIALAITELGVVVAMAFMTAAVVREVRAEGPLTERESSARP